MQYKYIVGIDEVGRGPLAGPVAVGAVAVECDFDPSFWKGIKDSKKLSHQKRVSWINKVKEFNKAGSKNILFSVSYVGSATIDKIGINTAIARAIKRSIARLNVNPEECLVLLDGGLRAPQIYRNQRTIIRGDESQPVISLASIIAKSHRDAKMERLSEKYPGFGFEENKGYGTYQHVKRIRMFGMCEIHRRSFLKKFLHLNPAV